MSSYYDVDGNTILNIPFPEVKFSKILETLGYLTTTDFRTAPFEQKRIVLLVAFREFLNGHLFLEEFGEIANYLTIHFDTNNKTPDQGDYELMIYEAADISLEARFEGEPSKSSYAATLDTTWKFFNKYKYLLDEVTKEFPEVQYFENPHKYKSGEKVFFSVTELKKKIKEKGGS